MTQENRDLLVRELCARLPYDVECIDTYINASGRLCEIGINCDMCLLSDVYGKTETCYMPNCKPYLFPLSSMTEEQKNEYYDIVNYISTDDTNNWAEGEFIYIGSISRLIHFYHRNHLDYRGLISMGLAIDATNLNIY